MLAAHLLSKNILKTQITLPFQWLNVTLKAIRLRSWSSSSSSSSSDSDTDSESSTKNAGTWKGSARNNDVKRTTFANSVTNKKRVDYLYTIKEVQKKRQIEKQITKAAEQLTGKSGENKEKLLAALLDTISNIQHEKGSTVISKISKYNEEIKYKYKTEQDNQKYGQWNTEREFPMEGNVKGEPSTIRMLQRQSEVTRYINNKFVARERYDKNPSKIRTLQNQKWKTNYDREPSTIRMLQNEKWKTKYDTEPSTIRMLQNEKSKTKYDTEPSTIRMLQNEKSKTKYDTEPSTIRMLQNEKSKTKYDTEPSTIRILQNEKSKTKYDTEPSTIRMLQNEKWKTRMAKTKLEEDKKLSISHMLVNQKINVEKISGKHEWKSDAQTPSIIRTRKEEQTKANAGYKYIGKKYEVEKDFDHNVTSKNKREAEPSIIRSLNRFQAKRGIQEINQLINNRQEAPINYQQIFVKPFESTVFPELKVWNTCEEKELQSFVTKYPTNAFEEMIQWTEEGKLWKFPIDNEQGMEKEHNIHFSEHVFLDRHLTGWCPNKGPIRHFMELVCVGLSKNPYMTIEEKYDHIMWYKDYFQDKTDLLQKLGLVD